MGKRHDPRQLLLTQHIKKQIVCFADHERNESRTSTAGVKLTATQLETLDNFSFATGTSKSTVIADALKLYFRHFDQLEKLIRYSPAVRSMLDKLP